MTETRAASQTLTFLFTDIEGSTGLWEAFPQGMRESLARHDGILRDSVEGAGGTVVKTTGDGLMAVFGSTNEAISAALDAQLALARTTWGETGPLLVRMGIHTGEVPPGNDDYHGPTVNRAARIMSAGHGGQVLLSFATASMIMDESPQGCTLLDLGEHELRGMGRPERVFQLLHPDLVSDFAPLATATVRVHELPVDATVFVGRETEIEQVQERLGRDSVRLVTLTGPGGIGKTRLALKAASGVAPTFEHGASFVDLSGARDTASALLAVGRKVGLADGSEQGQIEELASHLRDQHLLLVLDNFEQVTEAAPSAAQLLQECQHLKLLVTSREPLHVRGEHQFPVPPLSLPRDALKSPTLESLQRYEAIRLFVERAQAVRSDFQLTDENMVAVAEICLRLDGLPLAIELATARISVFSPEALRDRLGSRLKLLQGGDRDLPERQQTLRGTIEWSYELLEPEERRLLGLLCAFSGASFEHLEAAAARLDNQLGEEPGDLDPFDGLASLVDKSLVRQTEQEASGTRFTMLETIREYALERLDEDAAYGTAVRRAHAEHFADFALAKAAEIDSPSREAALSAMAAERENLRVCWRYWVAEQDLERLEALTDALWPLYGARGWYRETFELTADMLVILESAPPTTDRGTLEVTLRVSMARALMAMEGYTPEVEQAFHRALESYKDRPDTPELFPVLKGLASYHIYRAEFPKAVDIGRRILRLADDADDHSLAVDGHLVLGTNLAFMSELEDGSRELEAGISTFESHPYRVMRYGMGHDPRVALLTTSAFIHYLVGRLDTSLARAERAVELATTLGNAFTLAYARFHTGLLHLWRMQPEVAHARALSVLEIAREDDLEIWEAIGSCLLGAATAFMGRPDEGLAKLREGIAIYQGLRTPPVFWPQLLSLQAGASLMAGSADEGLPLIDEAISLASPSGNNPALGEFHILRGDLLAATHDAGAEARSAYEQAYQVSLQAKATMTCLHAAMRLARSVDEAADSDAWLRTVRDITDSLEEGADSPDLLAARALLESGPGAEASGG